MRKLPPRQPPTAHYRSVQGTFASLAAEGRKIFPDLVPSELHSPATELFRQGSPAREVYCIGRGLVKLISVEHGGREFIVGLRSSGWILGAAAVLTNKAHLVTAETLTTCTLHRMSSSALLDLLQTNIEFSWYLQRVHSREVYDELSQLVTLRFSSARHRLEQLLLQVISSMEIEGKNGMAVELPLKGWEIAQLVAVTPEHLSRVLKQMEQDEVIRRDKGKIIVTDLRRLRSSVDFQRLGIDLGKQRV